ncbi:MAG TPA: hypothetical protein VLM87_13200, partial [Rubrivivax sp.]|nr:hypothetical protein [Rubrivivax sp.]
PSLATPALRDPRIWAAIAAATLPSLLAFNLLPSSTVLNQALVPIAALVVVDYLVVAAIFDDRLSTEPDVVRIARGQRSPLFAHHADYGAATSGLISPLPSNAFDRAPHAIIDARLISAWARALHDRGDLDGARYLAGRLREFRRPEAAAVFAPCPQAAVAPRPGLPFQCELPVHERSWRDFLPREEWSPPAR